MYFTSLSSAVDPELSQAEVEGLRAQTFGPEEPGTVLRDFERVLDFIGEGLPVSARQHVLGGQLVTDLNARLARPHTHVLKRPRQPSFPRLHALYLLLRATAMGYVVPEGKRHVLKLDRAVVASWDRLNPTEAYFNLFTAWMTRLDEDSLMNDRTDHLGPLYRCHRLFEDLPDEGLVIEAPRQFEDLRFWPGLHHVALMELFGCVTLEEGDGKDTWDLRRIRPTPFGRALFHLTARRYQDVMSGEPWAEIDQSRWTPAILQKGLERHFPAWRRNIIVYLIGFREGGFVFKVSLEPDVWRRIVAPADAKLDALAAAILNAYAFDHDHLYQFTYVDPFGQRIEVNHPQLHEGPFANRVRVGDVPLREGQAMTYLYDFGDYWRFEVLLERIEPKPRGMRRPTVLEARGEAPEQYLGDDEWDDEEE